MQTSGASRREIAKSRLHVIASAAKQSILSLRGKMDCFVARAPRKDVARLQTRVSAPRRDAPGTVPETFRPSEGVGNAGRPLRPQPRVQW